MSLFISNSCDLIILCPMQVDIVDFNGSFLVRVRDLAGANPIILVVTKVFTCTDHLVSNQVTSAYFHFALL